MTLVAFTTYVSIELREGVALDRMKTWLEKDPCMLLKDEIDSVYMDVTTTTRNTANNVKIPLKCPDFECRENHPRWIEYQKIVERNEILKLIPRLFYCDISTGETQPIGHMFFFGWAFLPLFLVVPLNAWITTGLLWRRFYAVYISSNDFFLFEYDSQQGKQNIIANMTNDRIVPKPSIKHRIDLAPWTLRSPLRLITAPFQAYRFWIGMEHGSDYSITKDVYDRAKMLAFVRFLCLTVFLLMNIISAGIITQDE